MRKNKVLVGVAEWLCVYRNFMRLSIFGFGGGSLFAAAMLVPGIASQPGEWILLVAIFLSGGYVWGFVLWMFFETRLKEWEVETKRDA